MKRIEEEDHESVPLGVLIWEVFSWGLKPWSGIPNQEVIGRIEAGDRPKASLLSLCLETPDVQKAEDCPDSLHDFLVHHAWAFEAHKRPVMGEAREERKTGQTETFTDRTSSAGDDGSAEEMGTA